MEKESVVQVKQIEKFYQIFDNPGDRIKQYFFGGKKSYFYPFWALRDISFEIKKGQSVGIIGSNGSGKSTLLQILCGIIDPSNGFVKIQGQIASLLELGSGFNPEFTGRENVFMAATITGLSQYEIEKRYDEIVSFAEIGDFIDQSIKTYSTGMLVRLAFAVQTAIEPDILIIDEALSVGDIFFQQKCLRRMRELRKKGVTLLFVSHDMAAIRDLCDQTLYLKKGKLLYFGATEKAIQLFYQERSGNEFSNDINLSERFACKDLDQSVDILTNFKEQAVWINSNSVNKEKKKAALIAVCVFDTNMTPTMKLEMGENLFIRILYMLHTTDPVHINIILKNRYDQVIFSGGTYTLGVDVSQRNLNDYETFEFELNCRIEAGQYTFLIKLSEVSSAPNRGYEIDSTSWIGPLNVTWDYEKKRAPFLGMFGIPCKGRYINGLE